MQKNMNQMSAYRRISVAFVIAAAIAPSHGALAQTLLLGDFLEQVKSANKGLQASQLAFQAAEEKTADNEMVYKPTVFATVQTATDKKELVPISQRGSQSSQTSYQMGISKLTEWGTAAKLYYTTSNTAISDTDPRFVPEPKWIDAGTTLEVSHPLWKNKGGKDIATATQLHSEQSNVVRHSESLKRKMTLIEAEASYWRLVIARESLRSAGENLTRSKRLVDWNAKRVRLELADSADLIQARALADVRQMEYTLAENEERAASHSFNTARGVNLSVVKESLVKLTPELLASVTAPADKTARDDIRIAESAAKMASLNADLAGSKYDPTVDIFASATLNGRDETTRTKAMSESFSSKYPTLVFGVRMSAPLGGENTSRLRGGWAKDASAASLQLEHKRFEVEREWNDLTRKLQEANERLRLVERIESSQLEKLNAERNRHAKGRSTMFQVLLYESDYAQSQLNVIRNKAEILGVAARMKTFGGEG
jgi:outer membrane protein TolC